MEANLYSKEIMKHFKNPKNVGVIKNFDGLGKVGQPICGDVLWLYIKIKEDKKTKKRIISDAKYQTFGCVVALANASLLTTMIKGKTIEEVLKIKKEDLLKKLKNVPPIKIHCSLLAIDALSEAIYNYYKRNNFPIPKELDNRHKNIQQTLKAVEKKYKEYVKFEKKIWE
ncbi:MAG: iron-sulfur cluster assembly scaffold protein, partial [Candidatus Aenigmarchaeota archaeon]|nr:iron-sulfur cluster assembly scaffold protein [Candidatus Aenigmarchaeota archaeon]